MMKRLLQFDELLFRAERLVVAAMLGSMGLVVFLDVLHRVSTRGGSLLANPLVTGGVTALLGVFAMRTRGDSSGTGVAKGLGIGVGFAVAQVGFVQLVPNGLVWSQTLALALTLWLGLIGASLAGRLSQPSMAMAPMPKRSQASSSTGSAAASGLDSAT